MIPMNRKRIFNVVNVSFADDKVGNVYNKIMLVAIVASIIPMAFKQDTHLLRVVDQITVAIFIVDYMLRWITADYNKPAQGKVAFAVYPLTPWAIVDLLAILPSLTPLSSGFRLLKLLRAFRAFRVVKFLRYSKSVRIITAVLREQKRPLLTVLGLAIGYTLVSALFMFNAEPDSFETFFDAVYWATTALTTVGYGDIYPVTTTGRIISMLSSFVGIAVVALPSGIITAGYMDAVRRDAETEKENYHGDQIQEE